VPVWRFGNRAGGIRSSKSHDEGAPLAAGTPQGIVLEHHLELEGRAWHVWLRRALLLVVAACAVAGLADVFGQRPQTSRVANAAAILSVYSPSRVRGGLLFTTRFHITAKTNIRKAMLVLEPGWIEGMQVNSINPQPISEGSHDGRIVLDLGHLAAGGSQIVFIEFQVDPTNVGHRSQDVALDDGDRRLLTVHRSITIFP
jgi:hypothetical protein